MKIPKNVFQNYTAQQRWGGSCAVVGNSGLLTEEGVRRGQEIDQHDYVMRINQAPTEGYESYVGAREWWRVINGRTTVDREYLPTVRGKNLIMIPSSRKRYHMAAIQAALDNNLYYPSSEMKTRHTQASMESGVEGFSTGIYAIHLALSLHDEVTVYGFDLYSGEYSLHYWNPDHKNEEDHDWDKEREYVQTLAEDNKIEWVL